MVKRYTFLFLTLISTSLLNSHTLSADRADSQTKHKKMVWFRYKNDPLIKMVSDLAKEREINIMLPQGTNALTSTITFELSHKITLDRAWQYMITILNLAGFTIVPDKECSFIVKNDKNVNRESLPFYVGVSPEDLPNTDLKIRYLRYLSYLQVPGSGGGGGSNSLQNLFTQMLSSNSAVIYEPQLNAVLITDSARNIKSVMTIVDELDASASVQYPEFIKLKHTSASQVKTLFDKLMSTQTGTNTPTQLVGGSSGYFTKETKIVAEDRLNTLILLGKKESLARIAEFVKTYIDIPSENGKSVLHIYNLQYLKAENFAPILTQIVQNQSGNSQGGQSTSSGGNIGNRHFQGVIITSEAGGSGYGGQEGGSSLTAGSQTGNRLIIAALKDDWIRIENLIKELDKPQLQVMIHALIVDVSTTAAKDFANQVRNHDNVFFKDTNWQTGHIAGIENQQTTGTATPTSSNALMANLLPGTSTGYSTGNIASNATAGSFIMSFKDPATNGIWWVSKLLGRHTDSKILSQPFLTTINNKEVVFTDTVERDLAGATSQQFGVEVSNREAVSASITVSATPRINTNGAINLSLNFDISQFTGTNDAQNNRNLTTNVNLQDKDILILGGHTKTKVEETTYKTPGFGDVPFFGSLFKSKSKTVTKTNLMIFLRPEIIRPGQQNITDRFFKKADALLAGGEENFALLQDPITRWFFGKNPEGVSSKKLKSFRGELEPAYEPLKRNQRISIPMPEARGGGSKINNVQPLKTKQLKKPSEQAPIDTDKEELKAEEELKRLFAWVDKKPLEEEKTVDMQKVPIIPTLDEEKQAEKDLQELFQNDSELKVLLHKKIEAASAA